MGPLQLTKGGKWGGGDVDPAEEPWTQTLHRLPAKCPRPHKRRLPDGHLRRKAHAPHPYREPRLLECPGTFSRGGELHAHRIDKGLAHQLVMEVYGTLRNLEGHSAEEVYHGGIGTEAEDRELHLHRQRAPAGVP